MYIEKPIVEEEMTMAKTTRRAGRAEWTSSKERSCGSQPRSSFRQLRKVFDCNRFRARVAVGEKRAEGLARAILAVRRGRRWRLTIDRNFASCVRRSGLIFQSIEAILSEGHEALLYVDAALRRSLEKGDSILVGQILPSLGRDDALIGHIALVSNQNTVYISCSVGLEVGHPAADVFKRQRVRYVVNEDDTVCSAEISHCNSPTKQIRGEREGHSGSARPFSDNERNSQKHADKDVLETLLASYISE